MLFLTPLPYLYSIIKQESSLPSTEHFCKWIKTSLTNLEYVECNVASGAASHNITQPHLFCFESLSIFFSVPRWKHWHTLIRCDMEKWKAEKANESNFSHKLQTDQMLFLLYLYSVSIYEFSNNVRQTFLLGRRLNNDMHGRYSTWNII